MSLSIQQALWGDMRQRDYSLIGFAVATLYFFSIFSFPFLIEGNFWQLAHGDRGQHYVGYAFFVRDAWRFPLFHVNNLGYPSGTNIIFTDSIPIVSLISKVFASLLPENFLPFGLWMLACYLLQAHAVGSLLFYFGHRNALSAVTGSLFAVMVPFFLARQYSHAALSGHFVVVYALRRYFEMVDGHNPRRHFVFFAILLALALLIHPYLFGMVAGIWFAAASGYALRLDRSWKELGLGLAIAVVTVGATGGIAGHFSEPVPFMPVFGFGLYSMNLLSPVLGLVDATGGQYEGYNYWGWGILLLLLLTVSRGFFELRQIFTRRLGPLALVMTAFTLFALSNKVYLGKQLIASYTLPAFLGFLEQFHASGRFFWPVSYAFLLYALSGALRLQRRWLIATAISVALGLQWVDTASSRDILRDTSRQNEAQVLSEARWRPIVAAHDLVELLPSCIGYVALFSEIGRITARAGAALNIARVARADWQSLKTVGQQINESSRKDFVPAFSM